MAPTNIDVIEQLLQGGQFGVAGESRQIAEENFGLMAYYVGICYLEGKGRRRDAMMALKYLKQAADAQHLPAMQMLATLFWPDNGTGGGGRNPFASRTFQQSTILGEGQTFLSLSFQYHKQLADEWDLLPSIYFMAVIYLEGCRELNLSADTERHIKYISRAADDHHAPLAMKILACRLMEQNPPDIQEAFRYLRLAVDESEDLEALRLLLQLHLGYPDEKLLCFSEYLEYLRRGVELGDETCISLIQETADDPSIDNQDTLAEEKSDGKGQRDQTIDNHLVLLEQAISHGNYQIAMSIINQIIYSLPNSCDHGGAPDFLSDLIDAFDRLSDHYVPACLQFSKILLDPPTKLIQSDPEKSQELLEKAAEMSKSLLPLCSDKFGHFEKFDALENNDIDPLTWHAGTQSMRLSAEHYFKNRQNEEALRLLVDAAGRGDIESYKWLMSTRKNPELGRIVNELLIKEDLQELLLDK